MAQLEVKFNKGLNSKVNFLTDAPGYCLTFSDYQMDYGLLKPRTSMAKVNSSAIGSSSNKIDAVGFWVDNSQVLGSGQNGNLYINDATGGKFYRSLVYPQTANGSVTVTDITNSVAQNTAPITFASLNGILVYTGTGGHVNQITASNANCAALGGVSANFRMVRTVNNFMFGAVGYGGATTTNSTVYWSSAGDPTTWPGASNLTFRNNDGDSITALGELNSNLLIFKQLSIGLLSTITTSVSGTVTLAPLTTLFLGVGCVGPCAVDNLPDGRCIFLGTDFNLYVTDGSTLQSLSDNPPPGINISDNLIRQYAIASTYVRYFSQRNEIIVAGVDSGTTVFCYAFDMKQQYWRQITGITPYGVCVIKQPSGVTDSSLLLMSNSSGNIIDICRGNDATPVDQGGSTITPDLSASVVIPSDYFESDLVTLTILYKATNSVSYRYGFDNSYGSSATLSASNTRADLKISLKGATNYQRPSSFQINFQDNGNALGAGATLYKVMLSDEVTA